MIAVIDYGVGNTGSVLKAFQYLNIPVKLTADKDILKKADGVVLPGVGSFPAGIENLMKRGLIEKIRKLAEKEKPLLGICLGLQLFFSESEEGEYMEGLDLIEGRVKKFNRDKVAKIPHMGWNEVELTDTNKLFHGLTSPYNFYFVHSYYVEADDIEVVKGWTTYGRQKFASYVRKDNIWGLQCHPEKSSENGLEFLSNFAHYCMYGG